MGAWSRDELEREFVRYQERGRAGDWSAWADQFTEDAQYIEHVYGEFNGREAIREWIVETMGTFPGNEMPVFPIEWHIVDEDRGWIVAKIWNQMRDPGDGTVHQAYNFTLLKYAGDGMWSYEEDIYNPAHFADMIKGYMKAKGAK
jgi:ketosteroid isomerase-like protein